MGGDNQAKTVLLMSDTPFVRAVRACSYGLVFLLKKI